jgi:LmbE family N-acetylglucosaminyl deacetylase
MTDPVLPGKLMVVSPHLDDAVFGCGELLAAQPGSLVCTVFSAPPDAALRTAWDAKCGFANSHDAMRERHAEDDRALALLRAAPLRLPFYDSQYGPSPTPRAVADAITDAIRECGATTVAVPLGLFHSDHLLTFDACLIALRTWPDITGIAYEDALYRAIPGILQQRLAATAARGLTLTPARLTRVSSDTSRNLKRRAVQCYRSQLRAFGDGGYDDVFATERYWAISLRPSRSACRRSVY